jgi:CheY-like chemotaxis protein
MPPLPTARLRVLVAEDNVVNQLVARTLLERLGHVVDVVADGRAAVTAVLAAAPPYDLVLMDCHMPVMDGYDATRAIRAGETDRHTPVFALSASSSDAERAAGLASGMDRYLVKPIIRQDLQEALELV